MTVSNRNGRMVVDNSLNCPNCGAPISGDKCEYCGTTFIDTTMELGKSFYIKYRQSDGNIVIMKALLCQAVLRVEPETIHSYGCGEPIVISSVNRELDMSFAII